MPPARLRKTDALVLFGLVHHPDQPQREVAERLGLRLSTLNAAKKRLEKGGFATTVMVPSGQSLGFDSLVASFRNFTLTGPVELLARTDRAIAKESRRTVFGLYENLQSFSMSYARSDGDLDRYRSLVARISSTDGAVQRQEGARQDVFRLRDLEKARSFDFSNVLATAFGLPMPESDRPAAPVRAGAITSLPESASRLLRHLIGKPTATDSQAANSLGRSRQSVARLRQRLEDDGLLRRLVLPDLRRVGVNTLTATILDFAGGGRREARREGREWSLRELPIFHYLSSDSQDLILTASVDLPAARSLSTSVPPKYFTGPYRQRNYTSMLFALERADLHTFIDYMPLVEDALAFK